MEQELLLKRDELARAHQLGEFRKDYHARFGISLAGFYVLLLFPIVLALYAVLSHQTVLIILMAFLELFFVAVFWGMISANRRAHVYVYTGGLVYLNGKKERAVRWEQIRKADIPNRSSWLIIDVKDESEMGINLVIIGTTELLATIKREVDHAGSAGQEREPKEGFSMHCQFCNAELAAGAAICDQCGKLVAGSKFWREE